MNNTLFAHLDAWDAYAFQALEKGPMSFLLLWLPCVIIPLWFMDAIPRPGMSWREIALCVLWCGVHCVNSMRWPVHTALFSLGLSALWHRTGGTRK